MGRKVAFETHDDSSALNERGRRMVDHLFRSPAVAKVIVISKALAGIYASRYPAYAGKILVAHDGADPVELRREWSLDAPPAPFKAGYIGHLYPGRGIEIIVAMAERCPWAGFYVLGGAPEDVERWRSSTRTLPNLHFTGFLPPAQVESARSSFDVLLAPYQRKVAVSGGGGDTSAWMSPLKIFEYMSSGSPMIASDLPALREILEPGRTALLCPPEDVGQWVEALTRLRDDPSLRAALADNARRTFLREFTWQARAERVLNAVG
jgi:glycosyltransferase involved in cell wall biosynthesis